MRKLAAIVGDSLKCLSVMCIVSLGVHSATAQVATTRPALDAPTTPLSAASDGDFFVGPDYSNAPELTPKDGVPKGVVKSFTMDSKDSKMYPGISKTAPGQVVPYTRKLAIYIPSQYVPGTPAPFIICQDANNQKELPTILDNMINDHRIPVMVAIFIGNGGSDGPGSERGLEYDTVSGKYAEFVESEVLPKISADYNITFTKDPDGRATMGGSSGGSAAFSMAWWHPDLYHRVLTYSGTYVNQQRPVNPDLPHGAWEYHETLIPNSDPKPLRVWMEVGENDNGAASPESGFHNWVLANFHMAAVLKAKGYHYQFVYAKGARHVDQRVVRQTLPEALEWLWQGYSSR
ncbi:MAG: alpha/beta hydrolase-fold protein [Tepidisphaeraceae bacterium]